MAEVAPKFAKNKSQASEHEQRPKPVNDMKHKILIGENDVILGTCLWNYLYLDLYQNGLYFIPQNTANNQGPLVTAHVK